MKHNTNAQTSYCNKFIQILGQKPKPHLLCRGDLYNISLQPEQNNQIDHYNTSNHETIKTQPLM